MDPLTSRELTSVLRSMGVDLPRHVTFPKSTLKKRLRFALNAAQYRFRLPPSLDLTKPVEWPKPSWNLAIYSRVDYFYIPPENGDPMPVFSHIPKEDRTEQSLVPIVERGPAEESKRLYESSLARMPHFQREPVASPFSNIRMVVTELAKMTDCGSSWLVLDASDKRGHFINVRRRPPVGAGPVDPHRPTPEVNRFVMPLLAVKASLKLLRMNEGLVPPDFPAQRGPLEDGYALSVLFPVGPLQDDSRWRLEVLLFCEVCRGTDVKECTRCFSVAYCSTECQRAHWATHRDGCVPRAGGTWCTLQAANDYLWSKPELFGLKPDYIGTTQIHERSPQNDPTLTAQDVLAARQTDPLRNVWGDKPFVVKIALPDAAARPPQQVFVSDRRSSFTFYFASSMDAPAFATLISEMSGPRGGFGGKRMYRWARRIGDWTYSVCVDRMPAPEMIGCGRAIEAGQRHNFVPT
ncbi:uncharacterized protein BXZ73DRAFT_77052 [Epithele typhae]|uniref:uncharacterized protein n=1 Tax=Epithele typhae TaxID=378194 RepID=UPI0020076F6E|nr:uncharacterized protein BXZ73DRAFT_77052 [Epithele typhae]KAH9934583.1 hypothetical protein BXZ73DRAFT_77052 [Epithele typhae]